jgi:hypothetical protein
MIWSIKIGDIVEFPKDLYRYEVKDVYRDWVKLENCLTHEQGDVTLFKVKEEAKIIRRQD